MNFIKFVEFMYIFLFLVFLGFIKEFLVEFCFEIKVSEGSIMIEFEYWIYVDEDVN